MSVAGNATPARRFRLTGSYGTFEITRVVEALDEDEAWAATGITTTLEDAGWSVSPVDGESWEIDEVTS